MVSFADESEAQSRAHIPSSPLRQQRQSGRKREATSSSRPTRPTSPLFALPPVSPNVLRLRWKCAVSTCTSSTLSSLHVNKHPECIIGSVLCVHAVRRAADGVITAAKAHQSDMSQSLPQLLSSTTPTLHPLEAMWHSWTVTNHPTPPHALLGAV